MCEHICIWWTRINRCWNWTWCSTTGLVIRIRLWKCVSYTYFSMSRVRVPRISVCYVYEFHVFQYVPRVSSTYFSTSRVWVPRISVCPVCEFHVFQYAPCVSSTYFSMSLVSSTYFSMSLCEFHIFQYVPCDFHVFQYFPCTACSVCVCGCFIFHSKTCSYKNWHQKRTMLQMDCRFTMNQEEVTNVYLHVDKVRRWRLTLKNWHALTRDHRKLNMSRNNTLAFREQ